jgi:hypothetical protein
MGFRFTIDGLRSIEEQSVQMRFFDPLAGVSSEALTNDAAALPVKVNRFIPAAFVFRCKVVRRKST